MQVNEKFENRRHDSISTCTMENGKVSKWINPSKASDLPRSDSDDKDDDKIIMERR